MSNEIGRLTDVGIARESTRGTVRDPQFWMYKTVFDVFKKAEKTRLESGVGVIEGVLDSKVTKTMISGTLSGPVFDKDFGVLLLNTFGAVSSSLASGESAVWEHTFTIDQSNTHPSFTLTGKDAVNDEQFNNCMINSLKLTLSLGEYINYSADIMGIGASAGSTTPSYVSMNHFVPQNVSVKVADNVAGLSGASAITVSSLNLEVAKNLEEYQALGSVENQEIFNNQVVITGDMELLFEDNTYKTLGLADGEKSMEILIDNTAVTIGSAETPSIKITLDKLAFEDWALTKDNDDIVKQTVGFVAKYDLTSGSMVEVVLTNEIGGYTGGSY